MAHSLPQRAAPGRCPRGLSLGRGSQARGALALLRWDAAVMMPRGSADVRGEQLAALETEHHALLTAPRITRLLDRAQANTQGLADWQIANLHEMRRQRDHAIATPATLVSRLTKAASRAESRWLEARAQGKFEAFAPYLEEVVRSEEHTSELQSPCNLVCRLLLEKNRLIMRY